MIPPHAPAYDRFDKSPHPCTLNPKPQTQTPQPETQKQHSGQARIFRPNGAVVASKVAFAKGVSGRPSVCSQRGRGLRKACTGSLRVRG